MMISPEYKKLQEEFHIARPDYGTSSGRHCEFVLHMAEMLKTRDILDFGCGKQHLQKGIPFPIQNYDPCIPELADRPEPADIVVCTDVMEHVEADCVDEVIADLASLTKQLCFVTVAVRPASKFLPDGRNAHITQEHPNWWLVKFFDHFALSSYQMGKGEFTAIFVPVDKVMEPKPE